MPLRSSYAYLYNSRPLGTPWFTSKEEVDRARAGAPEGASPEGGTGQSSPPPAWGKFDTTAPTVPWAARVARTCGLCWQSCKSRPGSAAGARDEHEPHHFIIR